MAEAGGYLAEHGAKMVNKPAVEHGVHPPALGQYLDPEDWDSQTAGLPGSVWWLVAWLVASGLALVFSYV